MFSFPCRRRCSIDHWRWHRNQGERAKHCEIWMNSVAMVVTHSWSISSVNWANTKSHSLKDCSMHFKHSSSKNWERKQRFWCLTRGLCSEWWMKQKLSTMGNALYTFMIHINKAVPDKYYKVRWWSHAIHVSIPVSVSLNEMCSSHRLFRCVIRRHSSSSSCGCASVAQVEECDCLSEERTASSCIGDVWWRSWWRHILDLSWQTADLLSQWRAFRLSRPSSGSWEESTRRIESPVQHRRGLQFLWWIHRGGQVSVKGWSFWESRELISSLGMIANSHLALADLSPLKAKDAKCLQLARMHRYRSKNTPSYCPTTLA